MASSHPAPIPCQWFSWLAPALDRRFTPRLAPRFLGAALAQGRRPITPWIKSAKLNGQYQSCYLAVAAAGKKADRIVWRLFIAGKTGVGRDCHGRLPTRAVRLAAGRGAGIRLVWP